MHAWWSPFDGNQSIANMSPKGRRKKTTFPKAISSFGNQQKAHLVILLMQPSLRVSEREGEISALLTSSEFP